MCDKQLTLKINFVPLLENECFLVPNNAGPSHMDDFFLELKEKVQSCNTTTEKKYFVEVYLVLHNLIKGNMQLFLIGNFK